MSNLDFLFGRPLAAEAGLPLSYHAYRAGEYVPSEARPVITVRGQRRWYAPWLRYPDQHLLGMSEAMAFRAQDAMLSVHGRV